MRKIYLITLIHLLVICRVFAQHKTGKSSGTIKPAKLEIQVLDTIYHLKEVAQREVHVKKHSKGKRHLQCVIWEQPTNAEPFYWVKVVEDNGLTNYTHFNFFVYPKTLTIKYYDPIEDKQIDLKTWRIQNKDRK